MCSVRGCDCNYVTSSDIACFKQLLAFDIIQLLTIEALDMMLYMDLRVPILTKAEPRSILVFSGRYHIMSNASIVNNCFII